VTNADQIAANIYDREGMDHDEDIGDGAGVTHIGGQTDAWLAQWSLTAPTDRPSAEKNITAWMVLSGLMQVVNRSLPLGDAVCDFAYVSGERPAVRALQTAIHVPVDGLVGPVTYGALAIVDAAAVARQVAKARVIFLGAALTNGGLAAKFAGGELSRAASFL
jgi:hypothetical protein